MRLRYNDNDEFYSLISSDDSLFHYTKKATAIEKILNKKQIILSSFTATNDPYEYKNKMIGATGWGWNAEMEDKMRETTLILHGLLEKNTQFFSCCSNSFEGEVVRSHGCLKSRMWSQYGENHEGICLVFSKSKLRENLRNACDSDKYIWWARGVDYKEYVNDDAAFKSLLVNSDTFDSSPPIDVALRHIRSHYKELFFRKQLDYKDEDEYRIVVLDKDHSSEFCRALELNVSDFLVGLILGDRFSSVYSPTIDAITKNLGVEFRKLHWEGGEYLLLSGKQG